MRICHVPSNCRTSMDWIRGGMAAVISRLESRSPMGKATAGRLIDHSVKGRDLQVTAGRYISSTWPEMSSGDSDVGQSASRV